MNSKGAPSTGETYARKSQCDSLEFDDDLGDIDSAAAQTLTVGEVLHVGLHLRDKRQRAAAMTKPAGNYVGSLTAYSSEILACLKDLADFEAEVIEVDLTRPATEELVRVHVRPA